MNKHNTELFNQIKENQEQLREPLYTERDTLIRLVTDLDQNLSDLRSFAVHNGNCGEWDRKTQSFPPCYCGLQDILDKP